MWLHRDWSSTSSPTPDSIDEEYEDYELHNDTEDV
jgi:hypothetical protein